MLRELTRELQQLQGLGASFFRAAAGRIGLTATDVEVLESLAATGPTTAGQIAELTGLTTGAITGMLNRLEEAKLVRRERDPADGRRVIVQLATGTDAPREIHALFDSVRQGWGELASRYDDEQIAFLLEFIRRSNALYRQEILQLREAPAGEEESFSAPLGDLATGQLTITSGTSRLALHADKAMAALYQARFEGSVPEVTAADGVVTIRYPRRLWGGLGGEKRVAEVTLNAAIPWRILIQSKASEMTAELGGLELAGLEIKGGLSLMRVELPVPSGVVPIRLNGAASEINVRRPAGVAVRVHLKGWVSNMIFDDQILNTVGKDVRLQSPGYTADGPGYDIEITGAASRATITAG
jgi:DNA-binding MarR family transcriptional regulator